MGDVAASIELCEVPRLPGLGYSGGAIRRRRPPQSGQTVTSSAKTRANSAAQGSRWGRSGGAGESPGAKETVGDGGAGTVWLRSWALGARMP